MIYGAPEREGGGGRWGDLEVESLTMPSRTSPSRAPLQRFPGSTMEHVECPPHWTTLNQLRCVKIIASTDVVRVTPRRRKNRLMSSVTRGKTRRATQGQAGHLESRENHRRSSLQVPIAPRQRNLKGERSHGRSLETFPHKRPHLRNGSADGNQYTAAQHRSCKPQSSRAEILQLPRRRGRWNWARVL